MIGEIKNGYINWQFGKCPVTLFKYVNFDTLIKILENNSILIHHPSEFNDPFDCNYRVRIKKNKKEIEQYLLNTNIYKQGNILKEVLDLKVEDIYIRFPEFDERSNKTIQEFHSNTGVSCFTTDNKNLLMWAHYADKHNGACLTFDVTKDMVLFNATHKVEYVKKYPILNYFEIPDEILMKTINTKHEIWKYEQEYRIWKHPNKGIYPFNKSCLVEIILGYNLRNNNENKNKIFELIKNHKYQIKIKQSYLTKDDFNVYYE